MPPGHGLPEDGDRRDVVADGIVELAGELVALTEPCLLDVADAYGGLETDRRTERGGGQEEPVVGNHLASAGWIGDVRDDEPGQDDAQADHGFAT